MYYTKVRLVGLNTVDLPIIGALPSDSYICKQIDGLNPPEVDVFISNTANQGGAYQGRRPQNRQVVARIGLNPNYALGETAEILREALYSLLTPGSSDSVTLQIMNGASVIAKAVCYVTKFENALFSKDPEVQITFNCVSPYLQAPTNVNVTGLDNTSPTLVNVGSAPAGFHMELTFTDDVSSWTLTDSVGDKLEVDFEFLADDIFTIDTRPGLRVVKVGRLILGTTLIEYNLIGSLSSDSKWLMLHGGTNNFTTSSPDFDWGSVYFLPQYWGV